MPKAIEGGMAAARLWAAGAEGAEESADIEKVQYAVVGEIRSTWWSGRDGDVTGLQGR